MLVVGHDHGNMAVGSIVLSVVPIGKLIGTRKSEFAGSPLLGVTGTRVEVHAVHLPVGKHRAGGSGRGGGMTVQLPAS